MKLFDNLYNYPAYIFNKKLYNHYLFKKRNNINFDKRDDIFVINIDDEYGLLAVSKNIQEDEHDLDAIYDRLSESRADFDNIHVEYPMYFKLLEVTPIEAAQVSYVTEPDNIDLSGKDITIGIIDTGIDYLNENFIDENGKSRIEFIWDQTIKSNNNNENNVPYGVLYNNDDINRAIEINNSGGDPYSIVASKDEVGHGTKMASLAGGKVKGKNNNLNGVAIDCKFAIVKLQQSFDFMERNNIEIPIFDLVDIFSALASIYKYLLSTGKPVVFLIPLGSNSSNHRGDNLLDEYLQKISNARGTAVVTGTGDEGDKGTHASGNITTSGETSTIELIISEKQKNIYVEVWADPYNIFNINVISPSGEETGELAVLLNYTNKFKFLFENTEVSVRYNESITGDQLIIVNFTNIKKGTWILKLKGNLITTGRYDAWLPVSGISFEGTRFRPADPYGTITIPADSKTVVTAAGYNQNNDNTVEYSGMAFNNDYLDAITLAVGSVDSPVIGPNNKVEIMNGTSISAAITAGVCALLFEWGIVKGNYPSLYSQSILTFLSRGVDKRKGDIYPNPVWGYGMLNVLEIFKNMT